MVSVHASLCVLSKIHILVSVHARHHAHFSEFYMLWVTRSTFVPILWVGSGPGHLGPPLHLYVLNICCLGPVEAAPRLNSPSKQYL